MIEWTRAEQSKRKQSKAVQEIVNNIRIQQGTHTHTHMHRKNNKLM